MWERIGNYFGKVCNTHPSHSLSIWRRKIYGLSSVSSSLQGEIQSILSSLVKTTKDQYVSNTRARAREVCYWWEERISCHSHTYTMDHLVEVKAISLSLSMHTNDTLCHSMREREEKKKRQQILQIMSSRRLKMCRWLSRIGNFLYWARSLFKSNWIDKSKTRHPSGFYFQLLWKRFPREYSSYNFK